MKNLTVFFWGAVEDACSCLSNEYWRSVSAGWKGKSFIRIGLDTHAISGARAFYSTGCGVNEKNTTMGRKKWTCMNKNNNIHNNNHNNNTRRRRRRGEKTHKKKNTWFIYSSLADSVCSQTCSSIGSACFSMNWKSWCLCDPIRDSPAQTQIDGPTPPPPPPPCEVWGWAAAVGRRSSTAIPGMTRRSTTAATRGPGAWRLRTRSPSCKWAWTPCRWPAPPAACGPPSAGSVSKAQSR